VSLLLAVAGLGLLAHKLKLAYPILLVIGGLLLSVIPGVPRLRLDPDVWVGVAVIIVRLLCVFPATYLPRVLFPSIRKRDPYPDWRHVAVVGWTGMRGVVSLAAALAIPLSTADGRPFPGSDLILFLTFAVILATLVLQGTSLPLLIRSLGIKDDRATEKEEREARLRANRAALTRLNQAAERDATQADALEAKNRIRRSHSRAGGLPARDRRQAAPPLFLSV
jgi:CPA1 family monovalent cation:H+ antiporter